MFGGVGMQEMLILFLVIFIGLPILIIVLVVRAVRKKKREKKEKLERIEDSIKEKEHEENNKS